MRRFTRGDMIAYALFAAAVTLSAIMSGCGSNKPDLMTIGAPAPAPYGFTEMCKSLPEHELCKADR